MAWRVLPRAAMEVVSIPLDNWSLAGRLALAALLGGILGLNREMALKPAGMRTHALVSLGAALATITGLALAQPPGEDNAAPGRIIQGIVAGIGLGHRRDRCCRWCRPMACERHGRRHLADPARHWQPDRSAGASMERKA